MKENARRGPQAAPSSHTSPTSRRRTINALREPERCDCILLGTTQGRFGEWERGGDAAQGPQNVPVSAEVHAKLVKLLQQLVPQLPSLSLLLLHIYQLEPIYPATHTENLSRRRYYHLGKEHLEQVLTHVQRAIRVDDEMVMRSRSGAAIIFPEVQQQGAYTILERVYNSISLLQAETMLPPLTRETVMQLGIGTYPTPAATLEQLFTRAGSMTHCFRLRAAMSRQHAPSASYTAPPIPLLRERPERSSTLTAKGQPPTIPFMELPAVLPLHLQHLIPLKLARILRCIAVGRDQRTLTVAMADPTDRASIERLEQATGMTIFPVACDEETLLALLMLHETQNGS